MSYTAPTVSDFLTRFPEFNEQADADEIQAALDLAGNSVDETWIEADYAIAYSYLAAHILTIAQAQADSVGQENLEAITIGPLSIRYGKAVSASEYSSTLYGQQYGILRQRSHPAVLVI